MKRLVRVVSGTASESVIKPLPCPSCGYDLTGVPVVESLIRCPECGEAYERGWIVAAVPPSIRCNVWRVCVAPVVLVLIVLGASLQDPGVAMFLLMSGSVVAGMASLLMFASHATLIVASPPWYRTKLFVIGLAAYVFSLAICLAVVAFAWAFM